MNQKRKINFTKWLTGAALFVSIFVYSREQLQEDFSIGIFLLIGLGLGYVESRSEIGIATGYTDFFIRGSYTRLYGLLLLFGAGSLGAIGLHYRAAVNGAVVAYQAADSQATIPGTAAVSPVNFGLILGAFLFGVGLAINQGCGLGTLRNIGQGKLRYLWTLFFLFMGTIPGQWVKYMLDQSTIHTYNVQVYLPDVLGYDGTIIVTVLIIFVLALTARHYEMKRREQGTYKETESKNVKFAVDDEIKPIPTFSKQFLIHIFKTEWPRLISVGFITLFLFYALGLTGEKLAVTRPLVYPAVALFQKIGFSFNHPAFSEPLSVVQNGLLNNTNNMQNFGIVFGAAIYALTSGKFSFSWTATRQELGWFMLSGLLMGFGAVLASGCIVGALYSGIVNFSLSGWVVFAAMSLGIWLAVKLLNGRISTIPKVDQAG